MWGGMTPLLPFIDFALQLFKSLNANGCTLPAATGNLSKPLPAFVCPSNLGFSEINPFFGNYA